jgi:hypothetical protein
MVVREVVKFEAKLWQRYQQATVNSPDSYMSFQSTGRVE